MLCPARCSCFLCRELQSCRAADARKPNKMCDNFILKKSEAWEPMKFIRGAARLSVRHWQNREPLSPPKNRIATHKSTSCEQLYPQPTDEVGPFGMRRAPSTDRIKVEQKSLFKLLGNSKVKKLNNSDAEKSRRSVLNFRKNDLPSKNFHEKYVPLPLVSSTPEHIYSEPRSWNSQFDECCRPPVYQSVEKKRGESAKGSVSEKKVYNNRPPCYEELTQRLSQENNKKNNAPVGLANKITQNNNKVVIYFGDSIIRKHSEQKKKEEARLKEEPPPQEEVIYANRLLDETGNLGLSKDVDKSGGKQMVSEVQIPEVIYSEIKSEDGKDVEETVTINDATYKKEVFESVNSEGMLVVEFEGNFERARQLVELVNKVDHNEATVLDEDDQFDWSFIQDWRKRPSSGSRVSDDASWCGGVTGARALRVRVSSGTAPPAPAAHARPLSPPPHAHRATTPVPTGGAKPVQDTPPSPDSPTPVQLKQVTAVSQLTVGSSPVRSAPAQSSCALERRVKHEHHHRPVEGPAQNGVRDCNSSSDENRSSGHASMSDSGGGDASREEPKRSKQTPHGRNKHRPNNKLQSPWPGGGGLEDIRSAIKQLTLRSRDSSSTATSGASSGGGGSHNGAQESGSISEARRRRAPLVRQPSLDTVCTNVTSADEFVWVDSHNRLVELRCVPWSGGAVTRALLNGRAAELARTMPPDVPPRLAYLLQRALVRIAREAQRLSQNFNFCSKHEIVGAFRIILSTPLANSCIKAAQRAGTMYATSQGAARLGSAARAQTNFSPGSFLRWMSDVTLAPFVHEYAAVYLCAGMESLLESLALISGSQGSLTLASIEASTQHAPELWGLLQPLTQLGGRPAGTLSLSRWESLGSLQQPSRDSGITSSGEGDSTSSSSTVLLTTCAASLSELRAVLRRVTPSSGQFAMSESAVKALYYFMRCEQLEHGSSASSWSCNLWSRGASAPPPLGEWLRAARAHAQLRPRPVLDADDVTQAARLLLPRADAPPRPITMPEEIEPSWSHSSRSPEDLPRALSAAALSALLAGRSELAGPARAVLPLDGVDARGMTPLMYASLSGDERVVAMLLEAGADPNIETPGVGGSSKSSNNSNASTYTPPTAGWTALVYACAGAGPGAEGLGAARRLLCAGARPDGAGHGGSECAVTPLQVASAGGNLELVQLLLSHGADPFLSTQHNDALCYSAAVQYGCYSAIAVACAHGRRATALALLRAPRPPPASLSLSEALAEGPPPLTDRRALQDALYHAAETERLDITLELRGMGVAWSLHAWTLSLAAAAEAGLDHVIDQLLQDFLQVCPSDDSHYSNQFIHECLPLLFNILRYSKKEGTVLLLADILCCVYGWEPPPAPRPAPAPPAPRVHASYVNNPELADVSFKVEGRIFYGHKIVLVSESPRLRAMLAPPRPPGEPLSPRGSSEVLANGTAALPLVQINDIRYHIFEQVMKYLYSGGCSVLELAEGDVLEVLAAASFFQLTPLQRHCEARAAQAVDLHNLVSVYIHAKVYGATQLLEYCQGFLLQNMVALLTYDDSVKRLLFGKRLPGHNVLGALLTTLQKRIESRKSQVKNR